MTTKQKEKAMKHAEDIYFWLRVISEGCGKEYEKAVMIKIWDAHEKLDQLITASK